MEVAQLMGWCWNDVTTLISRMRFSFSPFHRQGDTTDYGPVLSLSLDGGHVSIATSIHVTKIGSQETCVAPPTCGMFDSGVQTA